jgi:putative hydrolase of the HAD superfamily
VNVVFDLGGVVLEWQPARIVESEFEDPAMRERLRTSTFAHPEWLELDRGTINQDDVVARGARRSGLTVSEMEDLVAKLTLSLRPIPGTLDLIRAVKDRGNRVYVLSNMPTAAVAHLEQEYSFWDLFDGIVFSSRVHMVKPESEIYQHLLDTYNLAAEDTVFIDDMEINLEAAAKLGIRTVKFTNPLQCETELRKFGCI